MFCWHSRRWYHALCGILCGGTGNMHIEKERQIVFPITYSMFELTLYPLSGRIVIGQRFGDCR